MDKPSEADLVRFWEILLEEPAMSAIEVLEAVEALALWDEVKAVIWPDMPPRVQ